MGIEMKLSSDPFHYSLNVWITSVLVSPLFFYTYTILADNREWSLKAVFALYILTVLTGALLSIPNWIVLIYLSKRAVTLKVSKRLKKIVLALTSTFLTVALLELVASGAAWWEQVRLCISYVFTVVISCLTFKLESD